MLGVGEWFIYLWWGNDDNICVGVWYNIGVHNLLAKVDSSNYLDILKKKFYLLIVFPAVLFMFGLYHTPTPNTISHTPPPPPPPCRAILCSEAQHFHIRQGHHSAHSVVCCQQPSRVTTPDSLMERPSSSRGQAGDKSHHYGYQQNPHNVPKCYQCKQ